MSEMAARITATPITERIRAMADQPVEEQVAEAARMAHDPQVIWICGSDDDQFRGMVVGLMVAWADNPELRSRAEHEIRVLKTLNAATSGVPVDFGALTGADAPEPLGLMKAFENARPQR